MTVEQKGQNYLGREAQRKAMDKGKILIVDRKSDKPGWCFPVEQKEGNG